VTGARPASADGLPGVPVAAAVDPDLEGLSLRPTLRVLSGRTLGFMAAFAIPVALSRVFSPAEFGTYREIFLIYAPLFGLGQLGMSESLYFFLPRNAALAGRCVANALATVAAMGLVAVVGLSLVAGRIAYWFDNPALPGYVPKLGVFLWLMLVSSALEIIMVSRKRFRLAGSAYAGGDLLRSTLFVIPVLALRSLDALLAGAMVFAAARCVLLFVYIRREFGDQFRLDAAQWKEQLRYALPFAASGVVEMAQGSYHQYAVASWVTPAAFAIYANGCLQIPVVDLFATSAASIMMVAMGETVAQKRSPLRMWHVTISRLAVVLLPMVAILDLLARELMLLLYGARYAASAPVFAVSNLAIILVTLPVDAVLRVYQQTRFLIVMNLVRLAVVAIFIKAFVSGFSFPGAVLVTVLATACAKGLALARISRLMQAPLRQLLPWRSLAGTALAAAAALIPAALVKARLAAMHPMPRLLIVAGVYGVCYLALTYAGRIKDLLRARDHELCADTGRAELG
jgi:O-antigen/teichoic acid export membrane protein